MKITKTTLGHYLKLIIVATALVSCFKQKPKAIESNAEVIQVERLQACTQMNLFSNLFDHSNILATFRCTQWSQSFQTLFTKMQGIQAKSWNNLLLPVSLELLNERENLKRLIAVSQKLDEKGGLVDLGNVIGALSDTNFYDGLNNLFYCSESNCAERKKVSKQELLDLMKVMKILEFKNDEIHSVLSQSVEGLSVLSSDFNKNFSKVLNSPQFKNDRMEMVNLLVSFLAIKKNSFEKKLIVEMLDPPSTIEDTIWDWVNSNNFSSQLFKDLITFHKQNEHAIKDLRSISQIQSKGLSCDNPSGALFNVNIEKHVLDLIDVFAVKTNDEISKFLESDLTQHQIATDACPNFKSIEVLLDGQPHQLSVTRLKKSMVDLIRVPGVLSLVKIASRIIKNQEGLNQEIIGELLEKYSEKNYLGSLEKFLRIIDNVSPQMLVDYEKFLKSFPESSLKDLSEILAFVLKDENHKSWQAFGSAWEFFNEKEKQFLFNYIDKHFTGENEYKALFEYYLGLYTIAKPAMPALIRSWLAEKKIETTYESLKELANAFNGDEVLQDFRAFFSRDHLVKVIELFVNGESLVAWANEISNLIPSVSLNQVNFNFEDSFSSSSTQCLDSIISSDLEVLIKDFPRACQLTDSSTLLGKLSLVSGLSAEYKKSHGYDLVTKKNFLNSDFIQSIILTLKLSSNSLGSELDFKKYLDFQNDKILNNEVFDLIKSGSSYVKLFPADEQQVLKSRVLKSLSGTLQDESLLNSLKHVLKKVSSLHKNRQWEQYSNPQLPPEIESNKCSNTLNMNIGGTPCADKQAFKEFVANFSSLLVRKNDDDSPIAARQFLKALDPSQGLPIPLGAREPSYKNLSLRESLQMFVDFSDKRNPINNKEIEYEGEDRKMNEMTTLMERIEIVIRDVNFDENYLGAHYKNSVAKSYDYNAVVESKYKLFNICVKAGFCGKFMNRREKKMARNAVRAFPSLLEANQGEFEYGDYMKALLGSVVSSSSRASQISSIVKFKKNGDGFNIPWIQTKKQLRKHNGKILSELAGVAAFSNMARWTNDRFARNDESFTQFINSKKMIFINTFFLKGLNDKITDESLAKLLGSLEESEQLFVDDLYTTLQNLDYNELRKLELMGGDLLVIAASLSKSNVDLNYNQIIDLVSWLIKNYGQFKAAWPNDANIVQILLNLRPYTSIISEQILDNEVVYEELVANLAIKIQNLLFSSIDEMPIFEIVEKNFNSNHVPYLNDIVVKTSSLVSNLSQSEDEAYYKNIDAISNTLNTKNLKGFGKYLEMSSSQRSCELNGELVYCQVNVHYLEPWKVVDYFADDKERWNIYVKGLINPTQEVSTWLYKSMQLIDLPSSADGD